MIEVSEINWKEIENEIPKDKELSFALKEDGELLSAIHGRLIGDIMEILDFYYKELPAGFLLFDAVWHHAWEKGIKRILINSFDEEKTDFLKGYGFTEVSRYGNSVQMIREVLSIKESLKRL